MALDKIRLREFLKAEGISQNKLAELVHKDVRTIRRWLSPKERLPQRAAETICHALGVSPKEFDPEWVEGAHNDEGIVVSARVSSASSNAYTLLKRQFGISKKQIVELAPLLFSLIAERALARGERMRDLGKKRDLIMDLLGVEGGLGVCFGEDDFEKRHYISENKKAAENKSIFGDLEKPEESSNFFADEIRDLSPSKQHNWGGVWPGECPRVNGYLYSIPIIKEVSCNDPRIILAILDGKINLSFMEDHLWHDKNKNDRMIWMRGQIMKNNAYEAIKEKKFRDKLYEENRELAEEYDSVMSIGGADVVSFRETKEGEK